MAVVSTASNHIKYLLATKAIDFANDAFKIILMNNTFAFDKDAHEKLSDVTAYQLPTAYGYTQNNKALSGVSVTENDTNDRADVTWSNVSWTASGGSIGPTGAAIIYDDTVTNDPIVGCIDFGEDYTILDTLSILIKDIAFQLS